MVLPTKLHLQPQLRLSDALPQVSLTPFGHAFRAFISKVFIQRLLAFHPHKQTKNQTPTNLQSFGLSFL
jgi:hypothetical protein